jgi:hypothetical protein
MLYGVHVLQGLVLSGTADQRRRLAAAGARVVPLGGGFLLVPATSALLVQVEAQHPGKEKGPSRSCRLLNGALARFARLLSETGPVAYVETDYFGGAGDQAATVFLRGERVLRRARARSGPVDAALRMVGVAATGFQDEFDTLGLGRYRETGAWVTEAVDP